MNQPSAIGIDIGSTTWKGVVIGNGGEILASLISDTEPHIEKQTERMLAELKRKTGVSGELPLVATGYGRKRVQAVKAVTEITCHARGAFFITKRPGVLIDIGGQDSKVIYIGKGGDVSDFLMNDKCAAGTGRFLEVILKRLKISYDEIVALADKAKKPAQISSTCTVFAESEVISLVAQGVPLEEIVKGLHYSLASRIATLLGKSSTDSEIFMSGGVALNQAMVKALEEVMKRKVNVLPNPQLIGALGAAISAL